MSYRRALAFTALCVAACSDDAGAPFDAAALSDAGAPAADARPGAADARPGAADAAPADANLPPSTANRGWIGGACAGPADCPFAGGLCLRQGFPNGMCTEECTGTCPDRTQPGDTITRCIDGRPFGFDQGVCVSQCDPTVLPPTGCAAGYACLPKNRYLDADTVVNVCVPEVPHGPCAGVDEIIAVNYPERGALWIPREAQCGGAFPLLVQLHGINPDKNPTPSLGGGRHIEYLIRSLIDWRIIAPVVVAEPVQTDDAAATSSGLYSAAYWEPAAHLDLLLPHLQRRGITISSLSYAGHSGAGCDSRNGLYLVLARYPRLIPAYAPRMALWGLEDVCYIGDYHWQAPIAALDGKGTAIINVWSVQNDPTSFENGLIPDPAPMPCSTAIFSKCIRHKVQPWCSYRTKQSAGITHGLNPFFFIREALPQVFPTDPAVQPCR